MISIIDYGIGNLSSIQNMLKRIGHESRITNNPEEINVATKMILPGVGAFDMAIKNIHAKGLWGVLNHKVLNDKTPVLGICLGMQLMAKTSEEGSLPGFGWIDAEVEKFRFESSTKLKIPHMGWSNVTPSAPEHKLFERSQPLQRFYFVHSYHIVCRTAATSIATSQYGYEFTSAVAKGNIMGVQFHPEKSHAFGMHLLQNFCTI